MWLLLGLTSAALAGFEPDQPPPPGHEEATAPRRYAVVVGLDRYEDEALDDLRFAGKDAVDLLDVLEDEAIGDFDDVLAVVGDADREEIWAAFDQLAAQAQREDTFVFYYAGHGSLAIEERGETRLYLLPSDATLLREEDGPAEVRARKQRWIALDELEARLEAVPARHRVMIIDACYNGTGRSKLSPATARTTQGLRGGLNPPTTPTLQRLDASLFAASYDQPAQEDPELENGVYTHFLIEALVEGSDEDADGLINIFEAHLYATRRTQAFTANTQTPWMEATSVGASQIFLAGDPRARRQAERAVLHGLSSLPPDVTLLVDSVERGSGGLDAGAHDIEVWRNHELLLATNRRLRGGQRVDLAAQVDRRREAWLLGLGAAAVGPALQPGAGGEADRGLTQPWALSAQASWWPADPQGARFAQGLTLSLGYGALDERPATLTGDAQAQVQLGWGHALVLGPTLAAGALWHHYPELGGGWRPVLSPGLSLTWLEDRLYVMAEAQARLLLLPPAGYERPPLLPTATVRVGLRL
ncbi:MAG: caspase family protein [Alphaproteobacteria bacterium]|nr:caspase family protein [Alphaproteobacteria bacterium]